MEIVTAIPLRAFLMGAGMGFGLGFVFALYVFFSSGGLIGD